MSQSAQVHSIDLLKRLHAALARFGVTAQESVAMADLEIRRVHDTLSDRARYWRQQVDRRHEEVARARAALSHARAASRGEGHGCVEQELDLKKAQQRLRDAEEKVAAVRHWQRELPELTKDYEGRARRLSGFLESDLRLALVLLENKVNALEAYASVAPSSHAAPAPPKAPPREEPS